QSGPAAQAAIARGHANARIEAVRSGRRRLSDGKGKVLAARLQDSARRPIEPLLRQWPLVCDFAPDYRGHGGATEITAIERRVARLAGRVVRVVGPLLSGGED